MQFFQMKSFVALGLIYGIVVRRFMHLAINENEYMDVNNEKHNVKTENSIPRLKLFCLKLLESGPIENISFFIISIYSLFTLFWLTYSEFTSTEIDEIILAEIDSVFLYIFLLEIIIKSFASNLMYLKEYFNIFDATIVILSLILNLMKII